MFQNEIPFFQRNSVFPFPSERGGNGAGRDRTRGRRGLFPSLRWHILNKDFFKEEKFSHWALLYSRTAMPFCPSSSPTCFPDELKFSMTRKIWGQDPKPQLWNSLWEMCKSTPLRNVPNRDGIVLTVEILSRHLECTHNDANLQGHIDSHCSGKLKIKMHFEPVMTGVIGFNQYRPLLYYEGVVWIKSF